MSYNQKPPGTGNSGMGGAGPPNGPNNPQVAKSLAGFQQQMPNFQAPQADLNALIQQQRIQNIFKQQQQHIFQQHFQQQMQQQQQQHQQQQQYKDRGGSSEPLALTRTPAAAELLNKTYQQHHQQHPNGNPAAANPTLNQLQQQLQVLQPNLMQQIQAFQLMQQHQQQQQQQHHAQTQQAHQSTPPPPTPTTANPLQNLPQQQLHGQKTQQQSAALSPAAVATAAALQLQQRYMTAAAAQATTNANKVGAHSVNPPTPPPLTATNQIKPPNLPPSTQITPVPSNSGISGTQASTKPMSANIGATSGASPSKQVAPSISLLPTKPPNVTPALPVAAHQQNKFNANKNQASTVGATATPTPAHNQKSTIGSDNTSHAVSIGNALQTTTESPTKTQNTNAEYSASSVKPISKGAPSTKAVTTTAAITGNVADSSSKSLITPLMPTTTSTIGTPLPSTGNPNNTQPIKPIESRGENASQKGETDTLKKVSTDKTPAIEHKDSIASNKLIKSDTNASVSKASLVSEKPNAAGSEKPANKGFPLNPSDVVAAAPLVSTNTNEKPKVQSLALAIAKGTNNNVIEKKEEQNEKIESSSKYEKPEIAEIALNKEVAAKKQKPEEEKPITKVKEAEISAITENDVTTTEVEKSTLKKTQNSPVMKKINEEPKANDERNKKKTHENKNIIKEPSLGQTKEQSRVEKDKEDETAKVEQTKTLKANSKIDSKDIKEAKETKEAREIKETKEESKVAPVPSPTKVEDPPVNAESISLKKLQRQPKSNKSNVPLVSTASVAVDEKTNPLAEKIDNAEKATSSRAARDEKRKKEKALPDTDNTPVIATTSTPRTPKQESNDTNNDRKSQRHRLKTILYQSPLPELAFITKLSASEASNSPKPMVGEDKLIVFYKNEYMAVRNAEGTFYLCQTLQNVYRTSPKISIRWLSEDARDASVYIPDFYDHTDIECVLTTVELKRIDKGHLRLPATEKARIENILKKAIDVEKGLVPRPELTEENPDGLDLSLYKDESQIEKKVTGSQTPVSSARHSKRNTISSAAKSTPKTSTSKAATKKRKSGSAATGGSAAKKNKSSAKKRKTIVRRKINRSNTSDDENESSEDNASDAEYRPSQKKSSGSSTAKSSPRVQRSPLAKARVASPIASSSQNKNADASKASGALLTPSRSERATKRKTSGVDSYAEFSTPPTKKTSSATDATSTQILKSEKAKSKEIQESSTASSKKTTYEATASNSSVISNAESENSFGSSASSRPTRSRK